MSFPFQKKYSLAKDLYILARAMYDSKMIVHIALNEYLRDDVLYISEFEELHNADVRTLYAK